MLHFVVYGKGKPVLIINGGPGMNCEGFQTVAEKLAKLGFQSILFDQRGTGQSLLSEISEKTITLDAMAEDIELIRQFLKIDKWTVFGQSFGGIMATHYYAKYPVCVEKLIFSASGGVTLNFMQDVQQRIQANLSKTDADSLQYYNEKIALGDTTKVTMTGRARHLAKAYVFDKSYAPKIAQRLLQVNFTINGLVFANLRAMPFDYYKKFVDHTLPVLILQGKNDIISVKTAEEIAESFGNAKLVLLDNCGHYGWLDSTAIYYSEIQLFLNQ